MRYLFLRDCPMISLPFISLLWHFIGAKNNRLLIRVNPIKKQFASLASFGFSYLNKSNGV